MRVYEKAIIIDERWISMILQGTKLWEMRSRPTRFRGPFALIRKRSGTIVGIAALVDSLPPLSLSQFVAYEAEHGIPCAEQRPAFDRGRRYPWVLKDARPLTRAVPYVHRSGQQIWVRLEPEMDLAIQAALA